MLARLATAVSIAAGAWAANGQEVRPEFSEIETTPEGGVLLELTALPNQPYRIETSDDFETWETLVTILGSGAIRHADSAAPFLIRRFYRAVAANQDSLLTGDHLATAEGDVVIHPIDHATFVMAWKGMMIYNDPVGGSAPFRDLPRAGLVLLSHGHGDHFDSTTVAAVSDAGTVIVGPPAVYSSLPPALRTQAISLPNGGRTNVVGLTIEAIPAYNLTTSNHGRGAGNGYVLTLGGKRIYISGDTEDIPEMRALRDIDLAFVCMNVPYTMSVDKAADAVREFRPRVVYPYHYRNQGGTLANRDQFRERAGKDLGIEVRLRDWY